jgi:hypothetical protein
MTALVLSACSSQPSLGAREAADANDTGRTFGGETSTERALLEQLPTLPSGATRHVGDATVVADAPYTAASGRTCRTLQVMSSGKRQVVQRLACVSGRSWRFVPDVFAGSTPSE